MSDLSSLIARLEKAEGPSAELDARIWAHFAGVKYKSHNTPYGDVLGRTQVEFTVPPKRTSMVTRDGYLAKGPYRHAEPVTSSIDAAVSLAERVLPGARWELTTTGFKPGASLVTDGGIFGGYADTPALAICLATLRALNQGGSSNG